MEGDKNARLLDLEPSAEFPILFGLLTERKKGGVASSSRQGSNYAPRRVRIPQSTNRSIVIVEEPDSSTPDDPDPNCSPIKVSGNPSILPPGQSQSPLLILRLTSATDNMSRRYSRRGNQEFQVIQHRRRTTKVISNEDDCTPSSTTVDDEERWPLKRFRTDGSDDEPEMPQLEPMVSTSSSSTDSLTPAPTSFEPWRQERSGQEEGDVLPVNSGSGGGSSVFYNPDARSYNCDYCDLKFKRQFHLLRHVAVHEDKREVCCHCNTAFYRKDNLLVHQSKCQQQLGRRQLRSSTFAAYHQPSSSRVQSRPARPPPRTLADLLDRDYDDDQEDKYGSDLAVDHGRGYSANNNGYNNIQLPRGLEISEVPNGDDGGACQQEPLPPSPLPRRRRLIETINLAEESDEEPEPNEDNVVEIFPCGHCREVFETFSRLLKHTAAKHIKNPTDGTFHFEIETILDE